MKYLRCVMSLELPALLGVLFFLCVQLSCAALSPEKTAKARGAALELCRSSVAAHEIAVASGTHEAGLSLIADPAKRLLAREAIEKPIAICRALIDHYQANPELLTPGSVTMYYPMHPHPYYMEGRPLNIEYIGLGIPVRVSEKGSGEVVGIAHYRNHTTQCQVDYVDAMGIRVERWWTPDQLTPDIDQGPVGT